MRINKSWIQLFLTLLVLPLSLGASYIVVEYAYAKGKHGDKRAAVSDPLSATEEQKAVAIYAKTCAACHGQHMEGVIGPSLVGVGSRHSLAKIEQIALRGKGRKKPVPMPAGLSTPDEARLLARWLVAGPKLTAEKF